MSASAKKQAALAAKKATASKPEASEPVLEEVSEIGVHVRAEIGPGVLRFVTGVTDDGRVLASDNARAAKPMHTGAARELLANKAVRRAFPTAQIVAAE